MARRDVRKAIAVGEGERLWQVYGLSRPEDLVLEVLALARDVVVMEGSLEKMEARLVRHAGRGLIRVKAGIDQPGRRRFAIAHELGHWELHKDKTQLFACTNDDMVATYRTDPMEAEANYFAAGLLMPGFLFREEVGNRLLLFEVLSDLAAAFRTSLTATGIRFVETSDDYVAIVASEGGKIRWWRGSPEFEEQYWIQAGSRLSGGTVAASLAGGPAERARAEEVDIAAWSKGIDPGNDTFIEESMHMARYGQTLSLLRLP